MIGNRPFSSLHSALHPSSHQVYFKTRVGWLLQAAASYCSLVASASPVSRTTIGPSFAVAATGAFSLGCQKKRSLADECLIEQRSFHLLANHPLNSKTYPVLDSKISRYRRLPIMASASLSSSAAAPEPVIQYLLSYEYVPDVLERRGPYRNEHLQLARTMIAAGKCIMGGPTTTPVGAAIPTGALFIFTDVHAAEEFVQQDPYVSAGIVSGHTISEFTITVK